MLGRNIVQITLLALFLFGSCTRRAGPPVVRVFAAASLNTVLGTLAREYEATGRARIRLSTAASSTLARQIEAGAPADIFISANQQWMDYLQNRNHLAAEGPVVLMRNRLVLIGAADAELDEVDLEPGYDLARFWPGRLAMGDPAHVPAGMYGREALRALGWWKDFGERIVPAANVREALRLVALGEVGMGIVYSTDARLSKRVRLLGIFPQGCHPPIIYTAARMGEANPAARDFFRFLRSPDAMESYAEMGFVVESQPGCPR